MVLHQDDIIMALTIGNKIPEILGKDQNGNEIKASDFAGKKLALYFYPKDNTPGCTAQACSLRDGYQELKKAGYAIIGISIDSEVSHRKFIEKYSLPFPLIADTDKKLIEQFGVWQEKKNYGKTYMGVVRTTFLTDEEGNITHIVEGRNVNTKEHAEQILTLTK